MAYTPDARGRILESAVQIFSEKSFAGSRIEDIAINERQIAEFFVSLAPLSMFFCFQEQWCDYFKIEKEDAQAYFIHVYEKAHEGYRDRYEK